MGWVVGEVPFGHVDRVAEEVRGRGSRVGRGGAGGVVVRRQVSHARALLYDRATVRQPDAKQLHAAACAAAGGAGARVVAVVAAMGAPPSHGGLS